MKHMIKIMLTLCLALVLFLPAFSLAEGDDTTLTVRGTAQINVAPDRAVLSLGFYAEDMDITKAQAETTDKINAILEAVKALGVEDQHIMTTWLNIGPVYNYNTGEEVLRGYRVDHTLSITVTDLSQVAAVMDAALQAGANKSDGIQFQCSTEGEVYKQALKEAIAAAQAKAEVMAEAAGKAIASMDSIVEVTNSYYGPMYSNAKLEAAADSGLGGTIMSGAIQVNATVEMQYELK